MSVAPRAATKSAQQGSAWTPTPLAPWEQRFVDLVNNDPKRRERGFVVFVTLSPSLQPLQAACSKQAWNRCFTARYRLAHGPVFGTLFRAFVDSAIAGAALADPPIGDYDPPNGRGEWPRVLEPVWKRMESLYGSGDPPPVGELSEEQLDALLGVLGDENVLRKGDRLILFGELAERAVDVEEWQRFTDVVAPRLPERVGVVVSRPPAGLEWPDDPHFLFLEDVPVEGPEAFRFRLSALRGDQPASVDLLGFGGYADALARFVLMPETDPLTIGIHGPWGKGKSSFMTLVERALNDSAREGTPIVTTWFNAWRYEDATQTWAGLASTISRAIEGALPWWRRTWSPVAYAWRTRPARFVVDLVVPAILLVAAVGILALAGWTEGWASSQLGETWGPLVPAGALGIVAVALLAARLNRVVRPVSDRLLEYVQLPDHRENMGYQHRVLDDLRFIKDRLPEDARVVVFIDDLDRCSDEKIMEILQAIHLILGASDFYVFVGIDTLMIYRAIEARYPQDEERRALEEDFPERYLRKIIQLPFHLPETATTDVYVKSLFSEAAQLALEPPPKQGAPAPSQVDGAALPYDFGALREPVIEILREVEDTPDELQAFLDFREFCADNPRELKRLVNVHRLVKILLQRPDAPMPEPVRRKLVKWLVFCTTWPDLIDDVLRHAEERPDSPNALAGLLGRPAAFAKHAGDADLLSGEDLAPRGLLDRAAKLTQLVLPDALPIPDEEEERAAKNAPTPT